MNAAAEKEKLYTEYRDKVMGYIFGKLQNRHDSEDLVSEVFLKVCEKYDCFDQSRASVSTWIYTITRNTVIDYFRTRRTCSELPPDLSDDCSPDEDILTGESLKQLAAALGRLDKRARDLIVLRYAKGMTLKDIAERMNISYAYVKVLHNNALRSLRALINEQRLKY